jgi:DNA-binding NarL/FixJ family response regulator
LPSTILIADDHPIVLSGLSALIQSDPAFTVVGTATDGRAAVDKIEMLRPDIAVLDLNMPLLTGLEVLSALRHRGDNQKVILLAATLTDAEVFDASENGAAGILLKEMAPSTLMECLKVVSGGGRWLASEIVEAAISTETNRRDRWKLLSSRLTSREAEIVALIVRGLPNKEIAFALGISEGTTKVHLNNIFRKLGVISRPGLLAMARGEGQ